MAKHHRGRPGADADEPFSLDGGESLGSRVVRLQHLMFEELYRLFRLEVSDPRLQEVVPTSLQLSPDLRNAKVMFAIRKPPEKTKGVLAKKSAGEKRILVDRKLKEIHEGLLKVTPFLRARLSDSIVMKRLPELHFHRDRLAEASLLATDLMSAEQQKQALASLPPVPPDENNHSEP